MDVECVGLQGDLSSSDELFKRPRTNQAEEICEGEKPWRGGREVSEAFALLGCFVMVMCGDGCDGQGECGEECGRWQRPGCWRGVGGFVVVVHVVLVEKLG